MISAFYSLPLETLSEQASSLAASLLLLLTVSPARSETREQWIQLGTRVHGAFGAFIPVGIRVGLDARERLKADTRGLTVTYYVARSRPARA